MKVVIAAAGIGSRLGGLTEYMHKTMLPIGKLPVLSRIIDSYPEDTEFLIALGYRRSEIRQYLELAHSGSNITIVDIDNFEGPGTGLGLTLKYCAPFLNQPFIFHSSDTLIDDPAQLVSQSCDTLVLCSNALDVNKYRTATVDPETKKIVTLNDKGVSQKENTYNYVGVCLIYNYEAFVEHLSRIDVEFGESHYFAVQQELDASYILTDTWYDIGDVRGLQIAQSELADFGNLDKRDEAIYFRNGNVIKYFFDSEVSKKRCNRAEQLSDLVPEIIDQRANYYKYNFIEGELLSEIDDLEQVFPVFLQWCSRSLFSPIPLNITSQEMFERNCFNFYYTKTADRLDKFYLENLFFDNTKKINGETIPDLSNLLPLVDWSRLRKGVPAKFHGDFHFENILKTSTGFKLIDWRHAFDDETNYGDLYYDLAKLYHGLLVNHKVIREEKFMIQGLDQENVKIAIHRPDKLVDSEIFFRSWLEDNGYDLQKVEILTALIFLNICPLHAPPYRFFLYYLGRFMLSRCLNRQDFSIPNFAN